MTVVPYDRAVAQDARRTPAQFAADWLLDPAEIANRIGGTDFVPKSLRNNPAAITAALLYGQEVGLGPMMSLSRIAVIDGRPSLAAEAQRALILAAGHDLWIEESTNTRCTIAGRRRGSELTSRVTWTLDDAKRAKLAGKAAWQAYPRAMLLARASAELARAIFADVIGGLAATEEIEDVDVDVTGAPIEPEGADAGQPKPATRRRRRVGTTAGSGPTPQPQAAPEPEPTSPSGPTEGQDRPLEPSAPTGEQAEPEPAPDAPAEPDAPNRAQLGMMFALYTEKGIDDRDAKLAYAERAVGRKINSSKELSALDVSRIIEALNAEPAPAPAAAEGAKPEAPPAPAGPGFSERAAGTPLAPSETIPVGPEHAALPPDEQAVMDALADELDARPVDEGEFPEGY